MFWQERQRRTRRREQEEEAGEVVPEISRDFVLNDRSSGSKTIKPKQAICQQLGTGRARMDRVVTREAWKFCSGTEGRHEHKGQLVWWSLS